MECIFEDNKKRIYQEGNKIYTLVNMGSYVGHRLRQWYETAPDFWKLMFIDEEKHHVEALINDNGDYISLIVEHGNTKRGLSLSNGYVVSDLIEDASKVKRPIQLGELYYSVDKDIYDKNLIHMNDYLSMEHTFTSEDGRVFDKPIPSDSEIIDFFDKNEKLTSNKNIK